MKKAKFTKTKYEELKNFDNFKIYFQTPNLSSVEKRRFYGMRKSEELKKCTSMKNYYVVYCIDFGVFIDNILLPNKKSKNKKLGSTFAW